MVTEQYLRRINKTEWYIMFSVYRLQMPAHKLHFRKELSLVSNNDAVNRDEN